MKVFTGLLVFGVLAVGSSSFAQVSVAEIGAQDPTEVVFDTTTNGPCWGRGADYKAHFDWSGACFVPFFGSDAPRTMPVSFALTSASIGGRELELATTVEPQRDGQRITYDRGALHRILPPVSSDATGFATTRVDFSLPLGGLVTAGPPGVRYQYWYRDPTGGPAGFNFSDALHVEHLP